MALVFYCSWEIKKSYKTWFAFLGYHIFTTAFRCAAEWYFVNFPSHVLAILGSFRTTIRGHQRGKKHPPTFISFLVFKHLSGDEESMKQHLWDASFTAEIRNTFKHKQQLPCLLGQSWPNHSLLSREWDCESPAGCRTSAEGYAKDAQVFVRGGKSDIWQPAGLQPVQAIGRQKCSSQERSSLHQHRIALGYHFCARQRHCAPPEHGFTRKLTTGTSRTAWNNLCKWLCVKGLLTGSRARVSDAHQSCGIYSPK